MLWGSLSINESRAEMCSASLMQPPEVIVVHEALVLCCAVASLKQRTAGVGPLWDLVRLAGALGVPCYPLLPVVDGLVRRQMTQGDEVRVLLRPLDQIGPQRQCLAQEREGLLQLA